MSIKKIVLLSCACAFVASQAFADTRPTTQYVKVVNKTGARLFYTATTGGCTNGLRGAEMAQQSPSLDSNDAYLYNYDAGVRKLCFTFYGDAAAKVPPTFRTHLFILKTQNGASTYVSKRLLPDAYGLGNQVSFDPANKTLELIVEK